MSTTIVGAGIVGVATAIGLRTLGHDCEILEARETPAEIGAGITVWPNGASVLDALGVDLQGSYGVFRKSEIRDWRGRVWRRLPMGKVGDKFGSETRLIAREDLLSALLARYAALGGRVRNDSQVIELDTDETSVSLVGGFRVRGTAVIGADGVGSLIRRELFGEPELEDQGRTSYRGLVVGYPFPGEVDFVEYHGVDGRFACYAVGRERIAWYANIIGPANTAPTTISDLTDRFRRWASPVCNLVSATRPPHFHVTRIRSSEGHMVRSKGRVVLVGDAAQSMTPDLGQGANQGLEDVAALLTSIARSSSIADAFRTYSIARSERVAKIAVRSARVGRMSNMPGRLGLWTRQLLWSSIPERSAIGGIVELTREGVSSAHTLKGLLAATRTAG